MPHWPCIEPDRKQKGWPEVGQSSELVEPLSPLQGTQVRDVVSQTGVPAPVHWLDMVHPTQLPAVVLHTGVGAEHCESMVQPTHVSFDPQRPERHTESPLPWVQGPSPVA